MHKQLAIGSGLNSRTDGQIEPSLQLLCCKDAILWRHTLKKGGIKVNTSVMSPVLSSISMWVLGPDNRGCTICSSNTAGASFTVVAEWALSDTLTEKHGTLSHTLGKVKLQMISSRLGLGVGSALLNTFPSLPMLKSRLGSWVSWCVGVFLLTQCSVGCNYESLCFPVQVLEMFTSDFPASSWPQPARYTLCIYTKPL